VVGCQPLQEGTGGNVDQGVSAAEEKERHERHTDCGKEADQRDRAAEDEGSKDEAQGEAATAEQPEHAGATSDCAEPPDRRQVARARLADV
jgi:hypothetical protein